MHAPFNSLRIFDFMKSESKFHLKKNFDKIEEKRMRDGGSFIFGPHQLDDWESVTSE